MICSSNFTVSPSSFRESSSSNWPNSFAGRRFLCQLIVEGFGRHGRSDRLHFLQIALASLGEVGYCIHVAKRLGYVSAEEQKQSRGRDTKGVRAAARFDEIDGKSAPLAPLYTATQPPNYRATQLPSYPAP